jgi:TRAP-type uncharacterized transport system substrate-binding protein
MSQLVLHQSESGDWTVAFLDGKEIYSGHSGLNDLTWEILDALGVTYEAIEYDDDEYQEKF